LKYKLAAIVLTVLAGTAWYKAEVYRAKLVDLCPGSLFATTVPWPLDLVELRGAVIRANRGSGCKLEFSPDHQKTVHDIANLLRGLAMELTNENSLEGVLSRLADLGIEIHGSTDHPSQDLEQAWMVLLPILDEMGISPARRLQVAKRAEERRAAKVEHSVSPTTTKVSASAQPAAATSSGTAQKRTEPKPSKLKKLNCSEEARRDPTVRKACRAAAIASGKAKEG
jgi:hypothetical protein